jgi:hypothetical protein
MFGVEKRQLEPIHSIAKKLDENYNPEKIGAWGILFLCCGALAVRNETWRKRIKNSDIFVCSSDLSKMMMGQDACSSDDYAMLFSKRIKEFSNYPSAINVIEKRMEHRKQTLSGKDYDYQKTYLVLAFMLNSFQGMSRKELLGFECQTWTSMSSGKIFSFGWPELFFAAGIILNNDNNVEWQKMASVLKGFGKSLKLDVGALFDYYAGVNPSAHTVNAAIRTDQLKKGMRIRLRSGWEALVVKGCDGNTLQAQVFGDFTETGRIYAHDVVAAMIDGAWVEVEMNLQQMATQAREHRKVTTPEVYQQMVEDGALMEESDMKEKTPLPKKTSTPLKSIQEKLFYSAQKEMLKTGQIQEEIDEVTSDIGVAVTSTEKPKEDPYRAAVGVLTGSRADRAIERGYDFVYGASDKNTKGDMVGMFSGAYADRLIEAGITIQKKKEAAPAEPAYGADNKIFTKDKADKAREVLRKKLNGTQLNMGLDPEIISAGIDLAGYHIEAGARKFVDYARKMIEDIGDAVRPYLKSFYMAARYYPGFDKTGMNTEAELDEIDESFVMKEKTPLPKKTSTPLKSIGGKIASSWLKEMLSGKNVPKKPKEK